MQLFRFAWFRDIEQSLEELAELAMDEQWDYKHTESRSKHPILWNYLNHTFRRLNYERKIVEEDDYATFNTGLSTNNQEEIYAFFNTNKKPGADIPWFFKGFRKESDRDLMKFSQLPECANYFDDPSELIYDTRLELRINYDHIIDENLERFPENLREASKHQLNILLQGAVEDAKKRVKRNYKTAIPQFYNDRIQLLLPLCLKEKQKADLALAVERQNDIYRASTCLTLDMAFNNARLIAKPDDEWLRP